jgi:hypothetical protein
VVAHACNPTWEVEIRRIRVSGHPGEKVETPISSNKKAGCGGMPIIPVMWEV